MQHVNETEALAREFAGDLLATYDTIDAAPLEAVELGLKAADWDKQKAQQFCEALDLIVNRSFLMSVKVKQAFGL